MNNKPVQQLIPVEKSHSIQDMLGVERDHLLEILQLQMESMPIACVLTNQDHHFTYWNPAAQSTFGFSFKEVEGKSFTENIVPSSEAAAVDLLVGKILRGETQGREAIIARNIRKDGQMITCEWYVTPLRDAEGDFLGLMAMAIDVTRRLKLEESQFQLNAILQQTTDAVIGADLEGHIFSWNGGAEVLYGYSLEEIMGQSIKILVSKGHEVEFEKMLNVARGQSLESFETVRVRKDGSLVDVSSTVSLIKDPDGKIIGVSAISRDISERKRAESSSEKNEEQVRLSQKMDAIGRLAGGVAHDFNNLLSVIGGNGDFLREALPPGSPHLEEVEEIEKAVQRGAELTKQLLSFGKKQLSRAKTVNLNGLSTEMSKMLKRLIHTSIKLSLVQDKGLKCIRSDEGQIQQVILNLVLNARDAMPKGGDLIVATRNEDFAQARELNGIKLPAGSYVCLTVTDTGSGMDAETRKKVFEPFFTTKGEKGTGLGLATVYGIVQQWEGHLSLESTLGEGTSFSIYFPALAESAVIEALSPTGASSANGSETILVTEDEEPVRKIVVRAMKNCGYNVLQAANGIEAIKVSWNYQEPIHLLLTDTVMPKMNGKELSGELKRARPKMKTLFMSGHAMEVLFQQGIIDPSIHLIQKPFSNEELAERVRKMLDEEPPPVESLV